MGWTEVQLSRNTKTADYIRRQFPITYKGIFDLLKFEAQPLTAQHEIFYVAYHSLTSNQIKAGVITTEREGSTLRYRFVSEDEGPLHYGASTELLSLLDEPTSQFSQQWREKCENYPAHTEKVAAAIKALGWADQ
jgi:hypothetical protein